MLTTGDGASQSAICCTMCKRGLVEIGHERFENGCFGPASWLPQEAGVVTRLRCAAIGIPFQSPHTTRRETEGVSL